MFSSCLRDLSLVLEDSWFAGWIASALFPYVTKLIVWDPRQNSLIIRGNNDDCRDAADLYRRLRLGELMQVFHSDHEHRMVFEIIVQQCLRFTRDRALEVAYKSKYHLAGWYMSQGPKCLRESFAPRMRRNYQ